jgi:SAM-dependent methyltransferase
MPYDDRFYDRYSEGSLAAARTILPFVFQLVDHNAVVDIGCGVGTWLHASVENGAINILGVDGPYVDQSRLRIGAEQFHPLDLTRGFQLDGTFDLALSLECAEHLPPECAAVFVSSLVKLAPVILFSAAIPHQGGTHHVNEQWPSYWARLFREHDYHFWDCLRPHFWNVEVIPAWYRQNAFLVASHDFFAFRRMPIPAEDPLPYVHPQIWMMHKDQTARKEPNNANRMFISFVRRMRQQMFANEREGVSSATDRSRSEEPAQSSVIS